MSRKKKPEIVVDETGFRWNLDDFDLDSHGVEAPLKERLEMLAELGRTPDEVSEDIRERYVKYLERRKKKVPRNPGAD
jgi:DnaJ-domain-containing protein 1